MQVEICFTVVSNERFCGTLNCGVVAFSILTFQGAHSGRLR